MIKKTLVADVTEGYERISQLFPDWHLTHVDSLANALKALDREKFHVIIVGMHFDESQIFDMIKLAKQHTAHHLVPVVAFRQLNNHAGYIVDQALSISSAYVGACGFVDTSDFAACSSADEHIRKTILACIEHCAQSPADRATFARRFHDRLHTK